MLAQELGGEPTGHGYLIRCPVPTHGKGAGDKNPSLLVWNTEKGLGVKCFAGCRKADIYVALGVASSPPRPAAAASQNNFDGTRRALEIWREAKDLRGTVADAYLRARGLVPTIPDVNVVARFHPHLWYAPEKTRRPGMVVLLRDIITDEPVGIIRTFLDPARVNKHIYDKACKLGRATLGRARHAAVKLGSNHSVATRRQLTVAEGFETAVSAYMCDLKPAWALGSAVALRAMPVLTDVDRLVICRENDPVGRAAAAVLARRWQDAGRTVESACLETKDLAEPRIRHA